MHYSYYILLISRDVNYYCYVMIIVGHVSELKRSLLVNPPESTHTCKKNKLYKYYFFFKAVYYNSGFSSAAGCLGDAEGTSTQG